MSVLQDNKGTIVCREVFDEASHPSYEEIVDYAKRLGIDPDGEPHLLDLAREGLMAALPKNWVPCFDKSSKIPYYYNRLSKETTWNHPLDDTYRELVKQVRAGKSRHLSIDDDSKTTAKDLESHDDPTLPPSDERLPPPPPTSSTPLPMAITTSSTSTAAAAATATTLLSSKVPVLQTKIPTKLAPLQRKPGSTDSLLRKRESRKSLNDMKSPSNNYLTDRISRDYTNLQFQDPKFYESPKLLDNPEKELYFREIVKRSESMSPRFEKDWEQLSSKFSSEENIIDIDKLSTSSLTASDPKLSSFDKFDKEKHPKQLNNQKELTLTGGGSMFLKSNRSRDNTPSQEGGRFEDFQLATVNFNEINTLEKPKSILREKNSEDDDHPNEEERKSVRFDLDKASEEIQFTFLGSEKDWESEVSEADSDIIVKNINKEKMINSNDKINKVPIIKSNSIVKSQSTSKIIGRRFLVENVSETDHQNQINRDTSNVSAMNKFNKIKNIDLFSKSESDISSDKNYENKYNNLDEIRKSKEVMLAEMKANEENLNSIDKNDSKDNIKSIIYDKYDLEIKEFKKALNIKLEKIKNDLECHFNNQKSIMEKELEKNLIDFRNNLMEKEENEKQKLIKEIEESKIKNLELVKNELEICYEKEKREILENLTSELNNKRKELVELRDKKIKLLENEYEENFDGEKSLQLFEQELTLKHNTKIDEMKKQLEKDFEDLKHELRTEQREKVTKVTEDHEKCLAEILRDFRVEENMARKVYKQRLEELRADFSKEIEKEAKKLSEKATQQETLDYEKIRCEKRILEDKYKTLKEKYIKLRNDVRLAVERRSKRKENKDLTSETEKSTSAKTRTDKTESSFQKTPSKHASLGIKVIEAYNQNTGDNSESLKSSGIQQFSLDDSKNTNKFESDDTTTVSETMNSNLIKKKKPFAKKLPTSIGKISQNNNNNNNNSNNNNNNTNNNNNNNSIDNPVENIRKQLEKLEELGDQLPTNETAYTLRYPFQDKVNTSSELEFFRHRIHVERDSIKRAKESLKAQKNIFEGIQKAWKQQSSRATLEQLVQEERELSEMEVSLHRTKSLLGEKVIHLKHLEQSLERVSNGTKKNENVLPSKCDELTLSDISSVSSGISSTDLGTDTFIDKPDYYQEPTEITASLENLNSEIREIWGVLNKRRGNNLPQPPTILYSDLRWSPYQQLAGTPSNPIQGLGTPNIQSNILSQLTGTHPPTTTTQNIIAQYGPNSRFTTSVDTVERGSSNLTERTRNMRDWLRQARIETTDLISPGQATL